MPNSQSSIWSVDRFFKTLNFFDVFPFANELRRMFFGVVPPLPPQIQDNVVFDFRHSTEDLRSLWGALDDVVMGGVSQSSVQLQPEGMIFQGLISTANSGGFASVRSRNFQPALNLSAYRGIKLWVKGDGQRYKFFLRDQEGWDSVAHAYSFDTLANQWSCVQIPFAEMKPVQRAKIIQHEPLNPAHLFSFQFMLSKFEYDRLLNPHFSPGAFQMVIQSIEVYS